MRPRRAATVALALVLGAAALWSWAARPATVPAQTAASSGSAPVPAGAAARGRALYEDSCVSCHGPDARGVRLRGPSLRGVGAAAIDFYLSTGRMPLDRPDIEPPRTEPVHGAAQRADLTAYLTGLDAGGPSVPIVHPERGDVARGRWLFADACSGCHQIAAAGGVDPEIVAPPLNDATPVQIAEAIRIGPYLMPRFGPGTLNEHDVDSIARFVTTYGRHPVNRGGWGIGNIGPIPEGLVAWLLAGGSLLLVARIIGKRAR
jgi:ubiquinol-cytochrome c reductase cytochrome c subunit